MNTLIKHHRSLSQLKQSSKALIVFNNKNNLQSIRELSLNPEYRKLNIPKRKLLKYLERDLDQKIFVDEKVKLKIYQQEQKKILQKLKIQKALKQINNKNQQWIKQMNKFQKDLFNNKRNKQFKRDRQQQESLLKQYNLVVQQKQKLKATKLYLSLVEKHDWNEIQAQKKRISQHIKDNLKKQLGLATNKSNLIQNKYKKNQQHIQNAIPLNKNIVIQRHKKKESERKAIGHQYLQHTKKVGYQMIKSKVKVMDLNRKNIDFPLEVRQLIQIKAEDLSKYVQFPSHEPLSPKRKTKIQK